MFYFRLLQNKRRVHSNTKPNLRLPEGKLSLTGFTLIETMIVLFLIAVMATLAIPVMLRMRITANEVGAIASCRSISTGCQNYYAYVNPHTYPPDLLTLNSSTPPYIDRVLASGTKQGYEFIYDLVDSEAFTLNANPEIPGKTGKRYFYVDETGVIKANPTGLAGPDDPPVP